ncbi:glycosyltransferase [Sulfurifustis variabilis]|uniref:Glycosyltransferase n=1 Tax=Sulfurifustis variabilis TaxID=1675686 RepID=A0A1B4V3G6_9GAMM|nr:glycosyltransferase family 4 protein [Sulfurifustis variabilis]BAU48106.1 glycosyltransferase [Sulfurifustis variabilis]
MEHLNKTKVLLCGPATSALGGGPTHIRSLLASGLVERYELIHFETGSRGRESPATDETRVARALRLLVSPFALGRAISRSGAEIVHLNSVLDHKALWRDAVYALVCRALGRKVVVQMHGGSLPDLCRFAVMRPLVRLALSIPDAIVLLASKEERDFGEHAIGVQPFVIPNGIDISPYRGATRVHSGRLRRLAYIGRLIRAKGIFEAIDAVELLRADPRFRDVELRIAGSGPAAEEIERAIRKKRLDDCVQLTGPVYGAAKIDFLREADAFVFPTYHREGLPYTVLESLAAGTPVIATRVAGIPDVVRDGVHGRLVAPRDAEQIAAAVRELSASAPALQAMSRECAMWAAEAFSLDRLAERFAEVYERLETGDRMARAPSG